MELFLFFVLTFYVEIITSYCVPFTQFPPIVTSYIIIVHHQNQKIGIDAIYVHNSVAFCHIHRFI